MEVKRFEGKTHLYLTIEPDNYQPEADYPMVVMLHGYASSMEDVARLSTSIGQEGYIYVCPNAPIQFQVRSGRVAYGWSSPGSTEAQVEEEEVQAAGELELFFEEVFQRYRVRPGRVLLMGFSQGGSLSLRCGLPRPETFAGLASLSGYLPDPDSLEGRLPEQRTQPVFISHGTHDQYIPLQQGQETRDFLEVRGYAPLYKQYPSMRHEVGQQVMEDLTPWIKKVLPPYRL
jgi:phospholipase/carboxylesterase